MRWFVILAALFGLMPSTMLAGDGRPGSLATYRILNIFSYSATWQWNKDQSAGFEAGLGGLPVEYRTVEFDSKRDSSEARMRDASGQAFALIRDWQPHLVYANDDIAQVHVTSRLVGAAVPVVFGAVNEAPDAYGFAGAPNVTGVLEREHFEATITLLRRLRPQVRKIAVVIDSDPTWTGVVERMKAALPRIAGLEVVEWALVRTFAEYKAKIAGYQRTVDAVAPLGVFNFKDDSGRDVPFTDVLRWTVENSRLPDFSYWDSRVEAGTLLAVAVSGYEQGLIAGRMARQILEDGKRPGDIPIQSSRKGRVAINLARARQLGIVVDSDLLLNAQVFPGFVWER